MARFVVYYVSKHHPTNMDGVAAGLRVARDDEYFQFFLPFVSGLDLVTTASSSYPSDEWWRAFVALGVDAVRSAIASPDFEPAENPTFGIVMPLAAFDIERRVERGVDLPALTDGLLGGQQVSSFEFP